MFEVNVFTPAQFGAFVAWLVINRGPLSALVHPNTDDPEVSAPSPWIWDSSWWGIVDAGITERSYPTSDLVGRQVAVGYESVQAVERGEEEAGKCECGTGGGKTCLGVGTVLVPADLQELIAVFRRLLSADHLLV